MDENYKHAKAFRDGTARAAHDAEVQFRREAERLANSGQLFPIKTVELGHEVTRFVGDIEATFAPFMQGARWRGKVKGIKRGGER